jgi:hypothetical protein
MTVSSHPLFSRMDIHNPEINQVKCEEYNNTLYCIQSITRIPLALENVLYTFTYKYK